MLYGTRCRYYFICRLRILYAPRSRIVCTMYHDLILLMFPCLGGWLELKFWSCKETCGYHIKSTKWCSPVYFTLPEHTSSCSSLHYIYIYLRGAYLQLHLFSLFLFPSLALFLCIHILSFHVSYIYVVCLPIH